MNTAAHMLHPDSKEFIHCLSERAKTALNGSNLLELSPEEGRAAFNKLTAPIAGRLKPINVYVEDRTLNIEGTNIKVRLYKPTRDAKDLPALIYCHGGGFVFGELEFLDYACRSLCEGAQCLVVAVDFRRAPEHKFPTAHMDCYNVARYIQRHAREFDCNGKLAVGGDSAGGNIAASICHLAKKNRDLDISFQLLFYPWVDLNNKMPSDKTFASGYFLETTTLNWMRKQYLSKPEDEKDPVANPQFQKDFSNLPPALIVAAECDPIHDDAKKYYQQLVDAGNHAEFMECGGILHDFCALPSHYEAALLAYGVASYALKEAFKQ